MKISPENLAKLRLLAAAVGSEVKITSGRHHRIAGIPIVPDPTHHPHDPEWTMFFSLAGEIVEWNDGGWYTLDGERPTTTGSRMWEYGDTIK